MRRPLARAVVGSALLGCGAITGVDKYDIVDCPRAECDGGADARFEDGAAGDTSTGVDADRLEVSVEDSAPAVVACPVGQGRLTVTVSTRGDRITSNPRGIDVSPGDTVSVCMASGSVELRADNASLTWSGVACLDGTSGVDRCRFQLTTAGATVTATR